MADKTEQLIAKLVDSHQAVRPFLAPQITYLTLGMVLMCALLLMLPFGLRFDWPLAGMLKTAALLMLVVTLLQLTLLLSQPLLPQWRKAPLLWLSLAGSVGLLICLGTMGEPLSFGQAAQVSSFWACIAWIAPVGMAAGWIISRMLRRARPLHRMALRLVVGGLAGSLAALVYSLHCRVDALAYLLLAYGLAATLALLGSLISSHRLWRW
ncbi:NrsF family protein [Alishewanella sp. HL-SH06]|uniref:NrsF family protein n=1 Tax=Alishewanella sp. HL-SH06 TaxID=3461144 RepID=UPI00404323D7